MDDAQSEGKPPAASDHALLIETLKSFDSAYTASDDENSSTRSAPLASGANPKPDPCSPAPKLGGVGKKCGQGGDRRPPSESPVQSYITSTVTTISSEIDAEIMKWLEQFHTYTEAEARCKAGIAELNAIKINLDRLIGRQKKDDALFYQSIIGNSYFFLENSLRIRREKFIRDLLAISTLIETFKHIKISPKPLSIDNSSFTAITNDIKDIYEEIERAKRNSSTLTWVKDDQISTLQEIEKDMSETLTYHIRLIEYFERLVHHELTFYK